MVATMIYRRLAEGEAVKDMHTTDDGNFEYRIVDLEGPQHPIPDGWSRSLTDAPPPDKPKKAKPAPKPAEPTDPEDAAE